MTSGRKSTMLKNPNKNTSKQRILNSTDLFTGVVPIIEDSAQVRACSAIQGRAIWKVLKTKHSL